MEGPEEGDSREKKSKKTKLETQIGTLNVENKENTVFLLPTAEQTENTALNEPKEKHTIATNTNNAKQNWDEMIEETEKFKDITNMVNPWVDTNLDEPQGEKYDIAEETKSDNLNNENPKGLEGLPEDCFYENIDDMLGLSDHETSEQPTKKTEVTDEPEQVTTHEQADTHTDELPPPIAASSPTGEEYLPTEESAALSVPTALPKEEPIPMVSEPIKDELSLAYGESREQQILQAK
ncbi:4182_t:CDS:2 [Gigaspora margarita]|uniref:4182_t:CDS:1 n=1 Tax=Gigaspora margarita TaxID=4874 RepID=A0ABN7UEC8_GIGMA|nr:4182_t:CDS:2 [Gigaspora margarita]